MPERETVRRAQRDLKQGRSPSTAAGEFVHEEIEHVREGRHGARSPQQAIAIGLSKARRAGVPLEPPAKGRTKESSRRGAERDYKAGQSGEEHSPSPRASRAREQALEREPRSTASPGALSRQASRSARERGAADRHRAAKKAARTRASRENRESRKTRRRSATRPAGKKTATTRASRRG